MFDAFREPLGSLSSQLSDAEDRQLMGITSEQSAILAFAAPSSSFDIQRDAFDPADGALYSGGASYAGLPLDSSMGSLAGCIEGFGGNPLVCLGRFSANLAGFDAVERRAPAESRQEDFRRVLAASLRPGTPEAGLVARALAEKSLKLASLADDRAAVTQEARQSFVRLQREVDELDRKVQLYVDHLDYITAAKLKAQALEKAKLALNYQKVNALATGLTQNALAQAEIAQQLALAVLHGRPDAAAALGITYAKLAQHSETIRRAREEQVAKARSGLSALEADVFAGPFLGAEKELGELQALGRLFKGRLREKIKEKVFQPIKEKVLKPVGSGLKTAAQAVGKAAAKVYVGLPCKIAQSKAVGSVMGAAGSAVGTVFGGPPGAAVGRDAAERVHAVRSSVCDGLDKIGITQGTFRRGSVRDAFKSTAKSIAKAAVDPKKTLSTLRSAAGGSVVRAAGGLIGDTDLIKTVTGGIKPLQAFAQTPQGGALLQVGQNAFQASGLNPQAFMQRMNQVATEQALRAGQASITQTSRQAQDSLVAAALRTEVNL
jgi:hypothetical protein